MTIATWQIRDRAIEVRKRLLHAGFLPIPCVGKAITIDGWPNIVATEVEIESWFTRYPDALNTGLLTRTTPAIDIDVYDPCVAEELETLLFDMIGTRPPVRFGLPPKRAVLFRTDKPFGKISTPIFVSPDQKANKVEVLCDGQQIIVHGVHPSGRDYAWHGGAPGEVARSDLPALSEAMALDFIERATGIMAAAGWIRKEEKKETKANGNDAGAADFDEIYGEREQKYALAALEARAKELERMAPNSGRNDALNKTAFRLGTMVARGWISRDAVERRLFAAAVACGLVYDDGERQTYATLLSGVGDGEKHPHPDLEESGDVNKAGSWDDPDISILDDRRGELPEFPVDVFSPECRQWIETAAHGAGVTAAHVAVPLLGIASSLIGTARRVQAARSWTQPFTTWTAIVGFSGTGKTPGLDTVKRALGWIERDRKNKIADLQHVHEAKVEAAKAARAIWKKQVEEAAAGSVVDLDNYRNTKKAAPPLPPEAIIPPPFVAPRLYVSDATIERLAVLLTVRPRGMLHIGDELSALFLNMSRYTGGSDREFWLEAWNGGTFTVERMSREAISVDYLLVGLVGGFQPDKVARSFEGDHDGLYSRILFAWPSEPPYRPLARDVSEVEPEIVNALMRLIDLEAGSDQDGDFAPRAVPLAPEAVTAFEEFRQLTHNTKQSLDGREREWLAKAQAHALRLAGTMEFLAWAFTGGAEPVQIGVQSIEGAVRLVLDYFWPHGRAALRQIGLSQQHVVTRRILRWLAAEQRTEFSRNDIRTGALAYSCDADTCQRHIDDLCRRGWCREVTQRRQGAGRPARRWVVNSRLFDFLDTAGNSGNLGNSPEAQPGAPLKAPKGIFRDFRNFRGGSPAT